MVYGMFATRHPDIAVNRDRFRRRRINFYFIYGALSNPASDKPCHLDITKYRRININYFSVRYACENVYYPGGFQANRQPS